MKKPLETCTIDNSVMFLDIVTDDLSGELISMAFVTRDGEEWHASKSGDYSAAAMEGIIPYVGPLLSPQEWRYSFIKEMIKYYYPTIFMKDSLVAKHFFESLVNNAEKVSVPNYRARIVIHPSPLPEKTWPPNALEYAKEWRAHNMKSCEDLLPEAEAFMAAVSEVFNKNEKREARKKKVEKFKKWFNK